MTGIPDTVSGLLDSDMSWLSEVINWRIDREFMNTAATEMPLPRADGLTQVLFRQDEEELSHRMVLSLALAPFLAPYRLDSLLIPNETLGRPFTEFGGVPGQSGAFRPTVETALFLLAGRDIAARLGGIEMVSERGELYRRQLISFSDAEAGGGFLQAALRPGPGLARVGLLPEMFDLANTGNASAHRLSSPLGMEDLVLARTTRSGIDEILTWVQHSAELLNGWGLGRQIDPGLRCLFHGPPGTGKTLTATLLGQAANRDVYRIDLSQVVSKWIGETEKNLSRLFSSAEAQGWLLFFDEADALFGKRTSTQSSNDRYANQEVSYLLQRIETFSGVAILASNLKGNIDSAFLRRFHSVVYFPTPGVEERVQLWRNMLAPPVSVASDVDANAMAREVEITGGAIVNVIRRAAILSKSAGGAAIDAAALRQAIKAELHKEGKVV